jgi:hypothetical protein
MPKLKLTHTLAVAAALLVVRVLRRCCAHAACPLWSPLFQLELLLQPLPAPMRMPCQPCSAAGLALIKLREGLHA